MGKECLVGVPGCTDGFGAKADGWIGEEEPILVVFEPDSGVVGTGDGEARAIALVERPDIGENRSSDGWNARDKRFAFWRASLRSMETSRKTRMRSTGFSTRATRRSSTAKAGSRPSMASQPSISAKRRGRNSTKSPCTTHRS